MPKRPAVVLFRRDLRLSDNPALSAAAASGEPVICLYVHDDQQPFSPGGAARWWLHGSLSALNGTLERAGSRLVLRRGPVEKAVHALIAEAGAHSVYWNRRYAPAEIALDTALKASLKNLGLKVVTSSATLLREPWEAVSPAGRPYAVFGPFWRNLRVSGPSREGPLPPPASLESALAVNSDRLDDFALRPRRPDWAGGLAEIWRPGEPAAAAALTAFLDEPSRRYAERRDFPGETSTSRLSPHLAFGEIGPLQIWAAVAARQRAGSIAEADADKFLSELAWREFAYHQLFHAPDLTNQPIRAEFGSFPYQHDAAQFRAWTAGRTGYPIVDAGMRELWQTGWMHNRVRMIAASFLTKHLLHSWQEGAAWFFDTLVDADAASNPMSWQWVAGCGADAAPYFRIFNPILQGEKFDPTGDYVRKFVPELRKLPDAFVHRPWEAPPALLTESAAAAGKAYPTPIVDHAAARARALEAFNTMKASHAADPA